MYIHINTQDLEALQTSVAQAQNDTAAVNTLLQNARVQAQKNTAAANTQLQTALDEKAAVQKTQLATAADLQAGVYVYVYI